MHMKYFCEKSLVGMQLNQKRDAVFKACRHGDVDLVKDYIIGGIDINQKDSQGNSLLHVACQNGNKRMCKTLLRKGCMINQKNLSGYTPLFFCIKYKCNQSL